MLGGAKNNVSNFGGMAIKNIYFTEIKTDIHSF